MKPPIDPALDAILDAIGLACVLCGMASVLCAVYGSIRLSNAQHSLLRGLEYIAPDVFERLYAPQWRADINPWDAAAFLKSDELDDVPRILGDKNKCRRAQRWLFGGLLGFFVCVILSLILGAVAESLGSTSIRVGG